MFMYIMSALLAVIAFSFYYFYIRRACTVAGIDIKTDRAFGAVIALIAACLAAVFASDMGIGAVFTLHILVFALVFDFANFIVKKACKKRYADGCKAWKTVYGSGIVPLVAALVMVIAGYAVMNNVVRADYSVFTKKSLRAEGYTVALISDVHYGISIDGAELDRICDEISAAYPSVVVLCGDIVDESTTADGMREVFDTLGSIKSEFGVFYVYGNHDRQLYSDTAAFTEAELEQAITDSGITVLRDEAYTVNSELTLIGREDRSYRANGGRKPIAELMNGVDPNSFVITLDHQPHEYAENADAGVDLILSGHTHGGQIFPANLLFDLFKLNDLNYGHATIGEHCQAIVTSGLAGWGFPVKTSAPAEYVIAEIKN